MIEKAAPIESAAAHTARELLAEVDTRSLDPNLWDATPFITLDADADASPVSMAKPAKKKTRPRPAPVDEDTEEIARRKQVQFLWIAVGSTVGLAFFTMMFLLLRRL